MSEQPTAPQAFDETRPPDLLYGEAEEDLRSAVRALLAARADAPAVIAATEAGTPYDRRLWDSLASGIGAAGLLVPEKLGGQGASHREAAVVLEELGRSVAPAPYLTSAVVATEILLALDTQAGPVAALLADLAAGRTTAVLALPPAIPAAGAAAALTGTLERTVPSVADAVAADVLLVPTAEGL
ncbi:acyl-CoA dehydrogenase family protein, partial [Streptomyces halstedii]